MLLSVSYFFGVVLPLFHHYSINPGRYFKGFDNIAPGAGGFLSSMAHSPGVFFRALTSRKFWFFVNAIAPAGFLCLLSPTFYISLPLILLNLISPDFKAVFAVWHWSLVIPFIYIGAIDTIAMIKRRTNPDRKRVMKILAAIAVLIACLIEARDLSSAIGLESKYYYKNKNIDTRAMIDALKVIPPDASVSATHRMTWWLAFREKIFINTEKLHLETDYVVISRPLHVSGQRITDWKLIPLVKDPESPLYKDFDQIINLQYLQIYKRKTPPN
jgi:hypothetical protein